MIRLLVTDCDGVLTPDTKWYTEDGKLIKRFSTRDMTAVRAMERDYGVRVAVLSGDDRVNHRFCQMHRLPFYRAVHNKADVLRDIIQDRGCKYQETAFIGDDLLDLEAGLWLQGRGGLFLCPSDAAPDVLRQASVIRVRGGSGVLTALYADRDYLFGDVK